MKRKLFSAKKTLIAVAFLLAGCGAQSTSLPLATVTLVTPIKTPTLTPTPNPTSTPTITPTPLGGKNGLLLHDSFCEKDSVTEKFNCSHKVYTYDLNSHQTNLLLEGYSPAGVSPDGKKILFQKTEDEKTDLFIVDLAKPEQIVLLQENADEAVWFPNTEWIGFISPVEDKRQVFIVHPDGSGLTQITNSLTGAGYLESAFNDGVFWGERTASGNVIKGYKWTKLDGTEKSFVNFATVSPDGKFVLTLNLKDFFCFGCDLELINVESSEKKKISLERLPFIRVQPLSEGIWVGRTYWAQADQESYILSSEGTILLSLADMPHSHEIIPKSGENIDSFDLIGDVSGQHLSPDGNLLLIKHETLTQEPYNYEASYYFLNLSTFEIVRLPELFFTRKDCKLVDNGDLTDCIIGGFRVNQFFWIEMP